MARDVTHPDGYMQRSCARRFPLPQRTSNQPSTGRKFSADPTTFFACSDSLFTSSSNRWPLPSHVAGGDNVKNRRARSIACVLEALQQHHGDLTETQAAALVGVSATWFRHDFRRHARL